MYTLCWSAKGGCGTTVIASALALSSARRQPTVLVDLGGDVPAALGVAMPGGPGVGEWLDSPHAMSAELTRLAIEVAPGLHLVHAGSLERAGDLDDAAAERIAHACSQLSDLTYVDAGRHGVHNEVLHRCASRSLMIVRPCYLAVRRSTTFIGLATEAIVVLEPGRALGAGDVQRALGVPIAAEVHWDPSVARAVDAGLLASRLPSGLLRTLAHLAVDPSVSAPSPADDLRHVRR